MNFKYNEYKPKFIKRILWMLVNKTIFRLLITTKTYWIKNYILRLFGANIAKHCNIYSSVDIFAPWNLSVGENTTIGPKVEIYNKDIVEIGSRVTISQYTFVCTASHNIHQANLPLVTKPIFIKDDCWIAANSFIGPGVTINRGGVVSATSSVFSDVDKYSVVRGNPAKIIGKRNEIAYEGH